MNHGMGIKLLDFLIKYLWVFLVIAIMFAVLIIYNGDKMRKDFLESDGLAYRNGFICYKPNMGNYSEMLITHEICHLMVNDDKKHFCGG